MGFLSSAGGFLDSLLDIDSSDAEAKKKAIADYLSSGQVASASQPIASDEGQALARALGTHRPVAYSEPGADKNDAAVAAVRQQYEDRFRNGGPAAGAAVQQAQLAGELTSRGTTAGIHQDILDSVARQQRVAAIAQGERADAGNAANALGASDANAALKRAVLQAQVSHANFTNAYNQDAALFGLRNTQAQLSNEVMAQQSDARYQEGQISLEQQAQQAALGKAILGALAGGVSGGLSTAMQQSAASAPTNITAGYLPSASQGSAQALGSYMLPAIQAGADVPGAARYQPIFNTPSAMPIDPGYWGGT